MHAFIHPSSAAYSGITTKNTRQRDFTTLTAVKSILLFTEVPIYILEVLVISTVKIVQIIYNYIIPLKQI